MSRLCLKPLDWLAAQGCTFVLVYPRAKHPLLAGWPDAPVSVNIAERHLRRGGNVGILLGRLSGNLVCLDLDLHFPLVCDLYPELAQVQITRPDAPERGKLLVRVTSLQGLHNRAWAVSDTAPPTVELLVHRRQALVPPSIHPYGSPYHLDLKGMEIPVVSSAVLASAWEVLTADPFAWYAQPHLQPPLEPPAPSRVPVGPILPTTPLDIPALRTALHTRFPTALAVFTHFGRVRRTQRVSPTDLRLLGNGGLIVGHPATPTRWRWYCFRDSTGGDVIDAVGYCVMGTAWDRYSKESWGNLIRFLK